MERAQDGGTVLARAGLPAGLLAGSLWVAAIAQTTLGLGLAALNRLDLARIFAEYVAVQAAAALSFSTMGAVIAARRPDNRIGWLLCGVGVSSGAALWVAQYARYALLTAPGSLPAGLWAAWASLWLWVPGAALSAAFLPLLFPDGRPPSARWRPVAWLIAGVTVMVILSAALSPGADPGLPEVHNPFVLRAAEPILRVAAPLIGLLVVASLLAAIAAVVTRFRRAHGAERQQLKWFTYASALVVAAIVVPGVLQPLDLIGPSTLLSGVLQAVVIPSLAVAVAVAILRYRLWDIDLLINRTLVYGALTASIVALYVLIVGYLGALFQMIDSVAVSLVAAGVVAVVFQPLRERLQRGVNRLLYGERDEPYSVLSRLGHRLEGALAPEAVLSTIVHTVREALKLPYAAIALRRDGDLALAAAEGPPAPDPLSLPLVYHREVVGELLLAPRAAGEPFSPADRRLLSDLARQAGIAVHGARAMADLQRAREWLVGAREEERRRLRRDLHDELAPTLAALGLAAATVGELIPADPAKAAAINGLLQERLRAATGEVRRLAHDLRPPALDELGLVGALRERADQFGAAGGGATAVVVEVVAPLPPLPAAVEVAALRISQEALMNVARHARAQRCTVRLATDGERALTIEVVDDGVGLPHQPPRGGIGLHSMRERAAELGGACDIERVPAGGTRVCARLPLSGGAVPAMAGTNG